ncbi:TerD family protein [Streptomyces sp.]|uniref:TerD family protein n=1 Tax=Streptomyces sp. TaxID=1931 RepID=UPI0028125951|nr:TerD family protein [Streptomyces sp.]
MTAELVRGQNHPLPDTPLEIRVSAGHPVVALATLGDADGRVTGAERVAHPGAPALPGIDVPRPATAEHRFAVDPAALPETVHRVSVLLVLPPGTSGPDRFGAVAAPFVSVCDQEGRALAEHTLTGLDRETAVVALELYRRQGAWKVRAVGQGYEGGLAALLADQGVARPAELADTVLEAAARPPASAAGAPRDAARSVSQDGTGGGTISYTHPRRRPSAPAPDPAPAPTVPAPASGEADPASPYPAPVAGDAAGWSMDERLYNQVWGMFEDLARTAAAYRSARDFAESRLDQELDQVLADPRARIGGAGDAARAAAKARHDDLVERAREVLDRDLDRLAAEAEVVEPALPVAYARWDNPAWHAYGAPDEPPMAVRLGDLHLPERPELRIPLLVRLPLERGIWVDSGRDRSGAAGALDTAELRRLALDTAVAHTARLLAVHPPGRFAVHVLDPAGSGTAAFAPLVETGVLAAPVARGAAGVTTVLEQLTERVDLLQMALRAGAPDALPPGLDTARQLLIVHDFPHGFDDRAVTRLRYLADEGPSAGVHLLLVADREDAAAYGPVLDPLWRSLLRLTPVPDDHLADPWVGHAWTYEPPVLPPGSAVLRQVLAQVAGARPQNRR